MKILILSCVLLASFSIENPAQWIPLNTGGINNYLTDTHFISSDTGWVVGRGPAILKTTDGGNTWINQTTSTNEDILSVYFLDGMNGWIGGYDGSIYKTTDGGNSWIQNFSGYLNAISQIKFTDQLIGNAVVGKWEGYRFGAIVHTTNGGENWLTKIFVDDFAFIDLDFYDADHGWAVGTNGLLCRTTNGGNSWFGPQFISDHWLHDVHFPDKYNGYVVGGTSYNDIILKTTDSGLSWNVVRQSFSNRLLAGTYFVDINKGWAVGLDGTILMTVNGGINWFRQETYVPSLFHDVFMIDTTGYAVGELGKIYKYDSNYQFPLTLIRPNGGETFYTGTQETINWIWSDTSNVTIEYSYGFGWSPIVSDYPNTGEFVWNVPNVNTNQALVKINKADDTGVYVISAYPFSIRPYIPVELVSFNAGVSNNNVILNWSTASETNNMGFEIQRSTDNTDFFTIGFVNGNGTTTEPKEYSYTDNNITPGKLFYRLKQVDFDGTFEYSNVVEVEYVGPTEYALNQNYPNPFNPSTIISYSIPGSEFVTIKIYDMLGNEVAVLVNEERPAGTHKIEFNSTALSSGTYFYRIQAGDPSTGSGRSFVETRKMILLK